MVSLDSVPRAIRVEPSKTWLGNDGSWSGFVIHVGTPPQSFTVLPSTNGQNIYIPVSDDCQRFNRSDCGTSRGVSTFRNLESPGFQSNVSSTWELIGLYEIGVNRQLGWIGNGISGYDALGLVVNTTYDANFVEKQVATAYATPDLWIGQLGLGIKEMSFRQDERAKSLLTNFKESGIIPSRSFGYTAGAPYRSTKVSASLTLGGYDQSRTNNSLTVPLAEDAERPLTVALQSIIVTNSLNGTLSLLHEALLTPIDSSVPELWLPNSVCDTFATAFGLQYQESSGRYAITDSTREKLRELDPRLTFTVADRLVEGQSINVNFPYAAFDLEANYPIFPDATRYFPLRRAANESQYMIGRVFLQEAYLSVDYDRSHFNVSQAIFTDPMPDSNIVTIMPANDTSNDSNAGSNVSPSAGAKSHHLSSGAIVGIVIGAIGGVLMIAGLVWLIWFRHTDEKEEASMAAEVQAIPKHPSDPEIMGATVAELPADHGYSEVEPVKSALYEVDATPRVHELR